MAPPFATDADSSEWFASVDRGKLERVHKVVEGKSTELDLSESEFTHIPGGVVETWKALTELILYNCTSLAALPESIGQLRALTTLYLGNCFSLVALPESIGQLRALTALHLFRCYSLAALPESIFQLRALTELNMDKCRSLGGETRRRGYNFLRRNSQIRERFPMATHAFAASVLFGSMIRERPSAAGAGNSDGDGGGGAGGAAAAVEVVVAAGSEGEGGARPPPLLRSLGAFPDCALSKLNGHGPIFASMLKRRIADYCGVSYQAAFDAWVVESDFDEF